MSLNICMPCIKKCDLAYTYHGDNKIIEHLMESEIWSIYISRGI